MGTALAAKTLVRHGLLDELVDYWRTTLHDAPVLQLPTDRPRPPVQTYHGDIRALTIDTDLLTALDTLARRHGTTRSGLGNEKPWPR